MIFVLTKLGKVKLIIYLCKNEKAYKDKLNGQVAKLVDAKVG